MRTSSYVIYVDLKGRQDEMLVVHGYTGAFDRVSGSVAAYLRQEEGVAVPRPLHGKWSDHDPIEGLAPRPSNETLTQLEQRGYLTGLSVEQEQAFLVENVQRWHVSRSMNSPQYIFMPTYDCNLRCGYCFQDHMRTDKKLNHLLRTMETGVIDRIFDAMPRIEEIHGIQAPNTNPRSIGFFGGEPLLARSRDTIEYIMHKARSVGDARFWAVTNGTELDAFSDLLGPEGIAVLQITFDGVPSEHDKRRVYADGSGSFKRIAQNLAMALEQGVQVQVRVNVDLNNINDLPAIARHAIDTGWSRHGGFSIYAAAIHRSNEAIDAKTTLNNWELKTTLENMRLRFPEMSVFSMPDERLKHSIYGIMKGKLDPAPLMKSAFCSAHDRMYVFDAFADIYACWERTGDPKFRIGRVTEEGGIESNSLTLQKWRSRSATSNPICAKCRYVLHCGGGCAVLAESQHGRFFGNHCDEFGKRFRASAADAYADFVSGKELAQISEAVCDQ